MKILAIDTSTEYLSVAVSEDDEVRASYHRLSSMRHSSIMISVIDRVLRAARLKVEDMDGFAVSIGPGSFTGLRIGVTTAKALAFTLKRPVAGIPTLDVIARNAIKYPGIICPVLDARKNKVYACFFSSNGKRLKRMTKYLLLEPSDLVKKIRGKTLFLGDGAKVYRDVIAGSRGAEFYGNDWHPRASVIAGLSLEKFRKKKYDDTLDLVPGYIYSKECDIRGR